MTNLRPTDIIAGVVPTVASTVVAQVNQLVGLIGSILGILYLVWRWRREYRNK
jgi:hypothetical protein